MTMYIISTGVQSEDPHMVSRAEVVGKDCIFFPAGPLCPRGLLTGSLVMPVKSRGQFDQRFKLKHLPTSPSKRHRGQEVSHPISKEVNPFKHCALKRAKGRRYTHLLPISKVSLINVSFTV